MSQELTLDQIQAAYKDLCAELGHLTLNQENTVARIKVIRDTISDLDKKAAALIKAAQEAKNAATAQPELKAVLEELVPEEAVK